MTSSPFTSPPSLIPITHSIIATTSPRRTPPSTMISGGESYVSSPPSFSGDGKKLLLCTGNNVSIFSTATGLLISELEGHSGRVTSVIVVPAEPDTVKFLCYCWTSSLDGTIRYWDFSTGEMLRKVDVKLPVHSMVIPRISTDFSGSTDKKTTLHAIISVEDTNKPAVQCKALRGRVQICDLCTTRLVGGFLTETRKPEHIILSPSKEYIGIRNKRKIHIWKLPTKKFNFSDIKMIKLHHTKNFTVLAFHPNERIVAGGDISGRIMIWRGFGSRNFFGRKGMEDEETVKKGDDDVDSSPTTWHWHAREVAFLSFSTDGAYLYSGGKEGVIVVWQLETGKRKFKPRLGSPLMYFNQSPDISLCSVSCADNRVHLLKMPSMEIQRSIAGIKAPFQYLMSYCELGRELSCSSASGLIAVRAENYCVQIFSLHDNKELSQVQVCERNYLPVEDTAVVITLVTVSADCYLMGTVENKLPEDEIGDLVCLKFWECGSHAGHYTLSTVVYEPHSDAKVSDLAFHPHNYMAASSSFGGDFKVWVYGLDAQKNALGNHVGWRCQSIGSYKKRPMTAAAFSVDGSVLAIAAETVVTLWDPNINVLVAVVGESITPITRLSFLGSSEYLITLSQGQKPQLTAWDLSKLSMDWCSKLLAVDISSKGDGLHFAVLALVPDESSNSKCGDEDGLILILNVENPTPVAIWSVKKAKGGHVAFVHANPSQQQKVMDEQNSPKLLAYINGNREYVMFDPFQDEMNAYQMDRKSTEQSDISEESDLSGYVSIYGKLLASKGNIEEIPTISFTPSERPWETIFRGSSHILPPLTKLCPAFFESLLEKKRETE